MGAHVLAEFSENRKLMETFLDNMNDLKNNPLYTELS